MKSRALAGRLSSVPARSVRTSVHRRTDARIRVDRDARASHGSRRSRCLRNRCDDAGLRRQRVERDDERFDEHLAILAAAIACRIGARRPGIAAAEGQAALGHGPGPGGNRHPAGRAEQLDAGSELLLFAAEAAKGAEQRPPNGNSRKSAARHARAHEPLGHRRLGEIDRLIDFLAVAGDDVHQEIRRLAAGRAVRCEGSGFERQRVDQLARRAEAVIGPALRVALDHGDGAERLGAFLQLDRRVLARPAWRPTRRARPRLSVTKEFFIVASPV